MSESEFLIYKIKEKKLYQKEEDRQCCFLVKAQREIDDLRQSLQQHRRERKKYMCVCKKKSTIIQLLRSKSRFFQVYFMPKKFLLTNFGCYAVYTCFSRSNTHTQSICAKPLLTSKGCSFLKQRLLKAWSVHKNDPQHNLSLSKALMGCFQELFNER